MVEPGLPEVKKSNQELRLFPEFELCLAPPWKVVGTLLLAPLQVASFLTVTALFETSSES